MSSRSLEKQTVIDIYIYNVEKEAEAERERERELQSSQPSTHPRAPE